MSVTKQRTVLMMALMVFMLAPRRIWLAQVQIRRAGASDMVQRSTHASPYGDLAPHQTWQLGPILIPAKMGREPKSSSRFPDERHQIHETKQGPRMIQRSDQQ
jgi:hypothetical protein